MTDATLSTNNMLHIDGRTVGQLKSVTENGHVQSATASRPQIKAQFRPLVAPATIGDPVQFDMPVYVSRCPSDHDLNPALIESIKSWLMEGGAV